MKQDDKAPEHTRPDELWAAVEANDVAGVARALDLTPREAEVVLRSARHSHGVSDHALLSAVRAAQPKPRPRTIALLAGVASAGAAAAALNFVLVGPAALPASGYRWAGAAAEGTRAARTVEIDILGPCALGDEATVIVGGQSTVRTLRHTSADGRAGTVTVKAPAGSGTTVAIEATCEGDAARVVRFEQTIP